MAKSGEGKNSKDGKKTSSKSDNNHHKVTHLYLNDKYLLAIPNLNEYVNLTVLYLHNNDIGKIIKLGNLSNLRSLYLQRNRIKKIENLDGLFKLQRLYLGHNEISVVENLEDLVHLEELHVEKQKLESGNKLCFDPRSVQALANNLEILNVCNNNLSTIQMLTPLKHLTILNASNNDIKYVQNISDTIKCLLHLKEANFSGNPAAKEPKYRETIIGKSRALKSLDGKDIAEITRSFIKRLEIEKNNFESRDIARLPKSISTLANNYPISIQKAVSNLILKPTKSDNCEPLPSTSDAYIPWKCMPSSFSDTTSKVPPLLRAQKKRRHIPKMDMSSLPSLL